MGNCNYNRMKKLYVVTPAFNDRPSLMRLLDELTQLRNDARQLVVVVVDDGSLEDPIEVRHLRDRPYDIELITLKRNLGHQRAIATGLVQVARRADADQVVIMDGDGEDRPQDVSRLLEELESEACDVVVAQRRKREESRIFKVFYRLYRGLFYLLTGEEIRFGNFCALTPLALRRLVHMEELWMHLPATIIASRLSRRNIETDRGKRYCGRSKMNLVSLITHGVRSVAVFVEGVLTRIILFCAFVALSSVVLILVALIVKLLGYATPGWLTVAVGALIGLLVQTATIALVSLLLAINTRNTAGLLPVKVGFDYVEKIDTVKEAH